MTKLQIIFLIGKSTNYSRTNLLVSNGVKVLDLTILLATKILKEEDDTITLADKGLFIYNQAYRSLESAIME